MAKSMTMGKEIRSRFEIAVSELEESLQTILPQNMPSCIGELERIKAVATQRLMTVSHSLTEEPEEKLLTIQGIAQYLQVPVYTARQFAKTKGFPAMRIGKHIRAELGALKVWARGHQKGGVDMSLYKKYNEQYHEGPNTQTIPEATRTHASPTGEKARRHRKHSCAVGAG